MVSGISFGGIASGLDTDSMITQLMQLERIPITRFQQRQADLKRVDTAWGDVVKRVSALRTSIDKLSDPSAWKGFVKATSSNESAVAVTASDGAQDANLSFTVNSLATRHQVVAGSSTYASADDLVGAGTFELTADGGATTLATITTDGTTTLADLAAQIDAAGVGIDAQVLTVANGDVRLALESTSTGQSSQFGITTNLAGLATTTTTSTGSDAQLSMGGLPITRSSNSITDLVDGMTITLKDTTTSAVTVGVKKDVAAAADAVEKLVSTANEILGTIASTTDYRGEDQKAGALMGDSLARSIGMELRTLLSSGAPGGVIGHGSQIGMSLTRDGRVEIDRAALETALRDDFESVADFFGGGYTAPDGIVMANAAGVDTGSWDLTLTQTPSAASVTAASYTKPTPADRVVTIQTAGGLSVDATLVKNGTVDEARDAIRAALQAAGVDTIQVSSAGGVLSFSETRVGSSNAFTLSGFEAGDGLNGTYAGQDISGTLSGGNTVTGSGSTLTVTDGPAVGMALEYDGGPLGALGSIERQQGLAQKLDEWLATLEGTSGKIQQARDGLTRRIDDYDDRILDFEERLELRERTLRRQFVGMETTLQNLQSQGQWLAGQLGGLSANVAQG